MHIIQEDQRQGDFSADIAEIRAILERVERAVVGNHQPGLTQRVQALEIVAESVKDVPNRVSTLERWRSGIVAVFSFITLALGFWTRK
jgi:hypothetical protein